MVTQKKLKEILHYNPKTGIFIWKISPSNRVKIGDIAGTPHNRGYITICVFREFYLAHRLAWFYMTDKWPKDQIDHINGIRNDNIWDNLREASRIINSQNLRKATKANHSTGLLGACPNHKKFRATIFVNHKQIFIGNFDTPIEAHRAYLKVKRNLHEGCTI